MKFIDTPISVEAHKGVPRRIRRGRRVYHVRRLLDYWILQSRWWGREERRVYFRLETDRGVMEVYREEGKGRRGERSPGRWQESTNSEEETEERQGIAHSPFIEGDTHTRELRQTESPYRPDAAELAGQRGRTRAAKADARTSKEASPPRWVLSKMAD